MRLRITQLVLFLLLSLPCLGQPYAVTGVRENIYRFTSDRHHGLFWVTESYIVVVDTINKKSATWLKSYLQENFSQPVKYVIYSHNHFDHSYGGHVFDQPGVTFISHQEARQVMEMSRANTRLADLVFTDELALKADGETLRMRYHGANNGKGSLSFHFPEQRVLYVVDWITVGRMPYRDLPGYDITGMILSTQAVLDLDWDLFVGGHANMGSRADVERSLDYLKQLYSAVRDGMIAGTSLEQLKAQISLEPFADFANYKEWLPLNIEGVYRQLQDQNYLPRRDREE